MPKNATRKALSREAKQASNRYVAKAKKVKLSPAERSQIAKARWAKIKAAKAVDKVLTEYSVPAVIEGMKAPGAPDYIVTNVSATFDEDTPAPPIVEQEKAAALMETVPVLINAMLEADAAVADLSPVAPPVPAPAPQLAPVRAPKQKRYTGPKEFSVALKAAEQRLAKAIVERAQAAGSLAALNAEIPSLLQIIQALKGSSNVSPVPYDVSGSYSNAGMFQAPSPPQFQTPLDPMDAIRAAMAAPPVSRAKGNAVELSPDVVGDLEGPDEDDDPDRYITGPLAGGGWK